MPRASAAGLRRANTASRSPGRGRVFQATWGRTLDGARGPLFQSRKIREQVRGHCAVVEPAGIAASRGAEPGAFLCISQQGGEAIRESPRPIRGAMVEGEAVDALANDIGVAIE